MLMEIAGMKCRLFEKGTGGPVVMIPEDLQRSEMLFQAVCERADSCDFVLMAFSLRDWFSDCAPWTREIDGKVWEGNADKTLAWMRDGAIPYIKQIYGADCLIYIAGYSMAGLLAMWSVYRTDLFCGAASCSGSLWYPGWMDFIQKAEISCRNACVYLSIGGREAVSGPLYMANAEKAVRLQEQCLKKDKNVRETVLQMNHGGHFSKVTERMAAGIAWLVSRKTQ